MATAAPAHERDAALLAEIARRRTFAIISHPDAGKTTLTEKLLLYAGALREAGAVRARHRARQTTSDWMELERQRGISISATVIRFEYAGHVLNLLDTPGHADFSEDTYRALYAADAAVMLVDAAEGLEPQTRKLLRVCRERGLPLITFVNKCDRPALAPLELLEQLASQTGVTPVPLTWPATDGAAFLGVIDLRRGELVETARTPRGATAGEERRLPLTDASGKRGAGTRWRTALEELELLEHASAPLDRTTFLAGRQTPVLFGSAAANTGVRSLLELLVELAPPPSPQRDIAGSLQPVEAPFSAFVFKVQANLDPRDRVAFLRLCSGRFARGGVATVARTGRSLQLKHAHRLFGRERTTIQEALAGDVVAVVDSGTLTVGDTLYAGAPVEFPPLPVFTPERFALARNRDVRRYKQFRRGLVQLAEEGAFQLLVRPGVGLREPILAAVGELQLEVARFRMAHEYGCEVELTPADWRTCCPVDPAGAERLRGQWGVELAEDRTGRLLALLVSEHLRASLAERLPELGWPISTALD